MENHDNSDDYEPEGGDFEDDVMLPDDPSPLSIDERKTYVPQLYEAGYTWRQIQKMLDINSKIVSEALHEAGLLGEGKKGRMPGPLKGDDNVQPFTPPKIPVPAQFQAPRAGGFGESKQQRIHEQPLRILDASYSQLTRHVTAQVDWFVEALTKIGWSAMMISFQTAQISSSEAFSRLSEFRDADQFVQFVNTYLQALWQAKDDAQALVKLEERNRQYDLLLFAAGERIKQLEAMLMKAVLTARTALTCMNQDDLRKFAYASALSEMQLAMAQQGTGARYPFSGSCDGNEMKTE